MSEAIPRILHAFWDGPNAMPNIYQHFLSRWRELHPEWEFILWNTTTWNDYFRDISPHLLDYFNRPEKWSPSSNPWQWRADIARYAILYDTGGVWIDCDLEPLRPIDSLLMTSKSAFLAYEDRRHRFVNNALMGSARAGGFISDVYRLLPDRVEQNRQVRVNRSIGAHFLTELLRAANDDVMILDHNLVYPYHWSELGMAQADFDGAYTKHHWGNMRALKNKPLESI